MHTTDHLFMVGSPPIPRAVIKRYVSKATYKKHRPYITQRHIRIGQSKTQHTMSRLWYSARLPRTKARKRMKRPPATGRLLGAPQSGPPIVWQVHIITKHLALYYGCHIRTAQDMMQEVRKKLNKKRNRYVTVKEFCEKTKEDQHTLQSFLNLLTAQKQEYAMEKLAKKKRRKQEDAVLNKELKKEKQKNKKKE